MKLLYNSLIFLFVVLASTFRVNAQCTLGASYGELKKHYNEKADLVNRKDAATTDGTKYVSYDDKSGELTYCSYFEGGVVVQYKIIGRSRPYANIWGEYFDKNFAIQGNNTWIDYASKQKWKMKVEDDFAVIWAVWKE